VSAMDVPRSDILQYILLMYRLEKYKVKKAFVRARVKMVREIYKRVGLWVEDLPGCLSHFDSVQCCHLGSLSSKDFDWFISCSNLASPPSRLNIYKYTMAYNLVVCHLSTFSYRGNSLFL